MSKTIDFGIYNGLNWDQLSTEYLHGLADMDNQEAIDQLKKIYNSDIENQKVGFGKFTGYKWIELDTDYIYWLLENIDPTNIKYTLANKALKFIQEHNCKDEDIDVIYVD
ncbi:MAG: hypothetical protein U9Q20_03510 [Campylobacterota bacterium]|nr:hypothetical protein [Campylobacterota bacterium]